MQHPIEFYPFSFEDYDIAVMGGDYPLKPFLLVEAKGIDGKMVPVEISRQYIDDRHLGNQEKKTQLMAKLTDLEKAYKENLKNSKITLQSLAATTKLSATEFSHLSNDKHYIHLQVKLEHEWFNETVKSCNLSRREILQQACLPSQQNNPTLQQAYKDILSDTALPLYSENYQMFGFKVRNKRLPNYTGRLDKNVCLSMYQFHKKHISADKAIITGDKENLSISFCVASEEDKLSNRLFMQSYQKQYANDKNNSLLKLSQTEDADIIETPDTINSQDNVEQALEIEVSEVPNEESISPEITTPKCTNKVTQATGQTSVQMLTEEAYQMPAKHVLKTLGETQFVSSFPHIVSPESAAQITKQYGSLNQFYQKIMHAEPAHLEQLFPQSLCKKLFDVIPMECISQFPHVTCHPYQYKGILFYAPGEAARQIMEASIDSLLKHPYAVAKRIIPTLKNLSLNYNFFRLSININRANLLMDPSNIRTSNRQFFVEIHTSGLNDVANILMEETIHMSFQSAAGNHFNPYKNPEDKTLFREHMQTDMSKIQMLAMQDKLTPMQSTVCNRIQTLMNAYPQAAFDRELPVKLLLLSAKNPVWRETIHGLFSNTIPWSSRLLNQGFDNIVFHRPLKTLTFPLSIHFSGAFINSSLETQYLMALSQARFAVPFQTAARKTANGCVLL